ncbi:MAG TPA: tetratricopeptide repeat protein, partial [Chthonomonadaceae bacterium]|nr:tetratricopeptide repeat protein [Chthonomonadaceae bacterium]
ETIALYRQIRQQAQQQTPPAPSIPAPPAPYTRPLPQPLTRFIGREEELEQIETLLTQTRLLTLTGTGGVGKTRLALRAAEELAPAFAEGVRFVELAALTSPALIPQTLAAALDVPESPGQPVFQALTAHLRARHLLLALDNCEHLLTDCARLVGELLQSCPRLHILATSRQALGLSGETVLRVPSLSLPASESLAVAPAGLDPLLQESSALRLFVDRAALSLPTFRLTPQNAAAVARLCTRLDGIPLAIELVAAHIRSLSVVQIADRLEANFVLLTRGGADRPTRHQTLSAAMDWSYALLSEEERRLLRRLSVFSGGFSLEASEAVCVEEGLNVLEPLLQLLEKSLLVYEEQDGGGRYRLLETVRRYAGQKLAETEDEPLLHARHRDYYTALAEEAASNLSGAEQVDWLACLDRERDNLRAALQHSDPPSRLRLAAALWRFWFVRGYFTEGRRWLEEALSQETAVTPARGAALYGVGNLAFHQGDYEAATGFLQKALAVHRALDDSQGAARDLNSLGAIAIGQGNLTSARDLLEQSLALLRALNDLRGVGQVLCNLGAVALAQGDQERARAFFEENLPLLRAQGEEHTVARCLSNLAIIAKKEARYAEAHALHQEGLEIHRRLGDSQGVAHVLSNLASLETLLGNLPESATLFRQALALWRELGDKAGIAYVLTGMAQLAVAQGAMPRAARLFGASEALREAIQFPIPPLEQKEYDRYVSMARAAHDEQEFAVGWKMGQFMTLEEALDFALRADEPAGLR